MESISVLLNQHQHDFAPIFGPDSSTWESIQLNLKSNNPALQEALNRPFSDLADYCSALDRFVQAMIDQKSKNEHKKIGIGGYNERRDLYKRSPHFKGGGVDRCIHVGIDLWAAAQTPVFSPLEGKIHSFQINNHPLDYGGTIVVEHQLGACRFYLLYGHLSHGSLSGLKVGQTVKKGEKLCELGAPSENGGWPPHLHFQVITDMGDWRGDFPGVSSEAEKAHYLRICPSPAPFLTDLKPI